MGRDPRREGEGPEEEQPLDVSSATRAANTASLLGRAPPAQPTAKIGAFDLEQALAKSRGDEAEIVRTPAIPFPVVDPPPAEPVAVESTTPATPEPPPKKSTAPVQLVVLAVLTIATLAFAIYAARSM